MLIESIGWMSSLILIVTIAKQVQKQWRTRSAEGVSRWLFAGQLAASAGFTVYSILLRNWVFAVTNGIMVLNGLAGWAITARFRRDEAKSRT